MSNGMTDDEIYERMEKLFRLGQLAFWHNHEVRKVRVDDGWIIVLTLDGVYAKKEDAEEMVDHYQYLIDAVRYGVGARNLDRGVL